jgi:SAM-dependent methyltransferase
MSNDWLNDLKTKFKEHPQLYWMLIKYISPVWLNKEKDFQIIRTKIKNSNPIFINLGSGPLKLDDDIINIDISRYKDVQIIADIHRLPFKDNSIDGVINIAVLEHVKDPMAVINESYRVLKKGGCIYSVIPFMQGYHASPWDYQRYTCEGIKNLHKVFECLDTGIYAGPTSGFLWILQEWQSIFFSFGGRKLYKLFYFIFMVTLWPIKFLDILLVHYPMATNIASAHYFLGKK